MSENITLFLVQLVVRILKGSPIETNLLGLHKDKKAGISFMFYVYKFNPYIMSGHTCIINVKLYVYTNLYCSIIYDTCLSFSKNIFQLRFVLGSCCPNHVEGQFVELLVKYSKTFIRFYRGKCIISVVLNKLLIL